MHRPNFRRALIISFALTLTLAPAAAMAKPHGSAKSRHAPRRGAGYVGVSSQKAGALSLPVDLRVSADGKTMSRFDIQWNSTCQSATGRGSYGGLSVTLNKKISPNGFFGDNGSFTRDFGAGNKGLFKVAIAGHFNNPQNASGSFRVTVTVVDASGKQTDMCDSGTVTWTTTD